MMHNLNFSAKWQNRLISLFPIKVLMNLRPQYLPFFARVIDLLDWIDFCNNFFFFVLLLFKVRCGLSKKPAYRNWRGFSHFFTLLKIHYGNPI